MKGKWVYRGEWTSGFKGRYGARQTLATGAKYEGTWATGLQDGYGCETYADGGTYCGQWLRGTRHGYGVRQSAPFGIAATTAAAKNLRDSLTSLRSQDEEDHVVKDRDRKQGEGRGGFVLTGTDDDEERLRKKRLAASMILDKQTLQKKPSLRQTILGKLRKQKSTGDIYNSSGGAVGGASSKAATSGYGGYGRSSASVRSTFSTASQMSVETNRSLGAGTLVGGFMAGGGGQIDAVDASVVETYRGEWKNDKRSGFGISERTDGLKYEGEWFNNKRHGYGCTTFKDGTREEGKYKNNVLAVSCNKKNKLLLLRAVRIQERVHSAVDAAKKASAFGNQKAEMAVARMATAQAKADQAELSGEQARLDSDRARQVAGRLAPDFKQPGKFTNNISIERTQNQEITFFF